MSKQSERARMKKRIQKRQKRKDALRPRYDLYLDKSKSEDSLVADTIERLIDRKKFHPTARRGILIEAALQEGNIDVLLEFHPEVLGLIKARLKLDSDDDMLRTLTSKLERIENKLDEKALPVNAPLVASPGFKPLAPLPDDDDKVVIRKDTNAGADNAANFLGAAFGFQGIPVPAPKTSGIKEIKVNIPMPAITDDDDDFPVMKKQMHQ